MRLRTALFTGALVIVIAGFAMAADGTHPVPMENNECTACHVDVTPDVVAEWEASAHGFTGVKCGVCHGDEANFRPQPAADTCRTCHAEQVGAINAETADCSACHSPHHYTVHHVSNYK